MRQRVLWSDRGTMRGLTIRQPWAAAIARGLKRVENRTWSTAYRGRLLIHAGKSRASLGALPASELDPLSFAFGAIVAVCELVDCLPIDRVEPGPFVEGPVCWVLDRIVALPEPVSYRGGQRLWHPSPDVVEAISAQIAAFDAGSVPSPNPSPASAIGPPSTEAFVRDQFPAAAAKILPDW
jgi:hypothetical protein